MRTFSLLKGLPAYNEDGDKVGDVCDFCIQEEGTISDIILSGKGLIGKKIRIPICSILSFGEDGIIISNQAQGSAYKEVDSEYTMHHSQPLSKKNTLSQEGEQLGLLDDVYFLEEVGTIIGYELTDGFFSDITEGKRVIRTLEPPKIGKDAIIVSGNKLRGGKSNDEVSELPK